MLRGYNNEQAGGLPLPAEGDKKSFLSATSTAIDGGGENQGGVEAALNLMLSTVLCVSLSLPPMMTRIEVSFTWTAGESWGAIFLARTSLG